MGRELLLDTGGLIALLDRSERHHAACRAAYEDWDGPVVSTEAVVTEATHLVSRIPSGREACLGFFLAGGARLVPQSTSGLERCQRLISKYSDRPMDYADATLVVLAEDLRSDAILTLDHDFEIYRLFGRQPFRRLPSAGN